MREGYRLGAYRLVRRIGEGGMGTVWTAEHAVLGRCAAIKILHPEYSTRTGAITRFFNEARAATAISDPGIIQIFDVGRHDGSAYIVMELLEGEPLDVRLSRMGALPLGTALRLCRQAASAIGAAHARGIVHRDLKPENIFVVRDPEVLGGERAKVLDFGIAKLADGIGLKLKTNASAIVGTPPYMSPEQCRGAGEVDQRADIYSLGCVLFTLVVGRPPFASKSSGVLIMQHLSDPPPRPSSLAPELPGDVDGLILRCLEKRPGDRFASGAELAQAIDAIEALPSVVRAAPYAFAAVPTEQVITTLGSSAIYVTPPTQASRPPRRIRRYVGLAAMLMAAAGAAVALVPRPPSPGASAQPGAVLGDTGHPAPPPPPAPPPIDPRPAQAKAELRALLAAFMAWAEHHAGAPCPAAADLLGGGEAIGGARGARLDPWGRAYELTCTDQPADQIVGVRSSGPDGALETDDDLVSWTLDDVMKLVRGSRWKAALARAPQPVPALRPAPAPAARPRARPPGKSPAPRPSVNDGIVDLDGDGIPDRRQ
jgi:serine/threonine protein kinase